MSHETRTTCNRDCPDSCGIVATVENGRITSHRGDPEHGVTRGFLCYRGNHYLERFGSRERILHPQRKTTHGWQRLSWDDALDLAAEKLARQRDTDGPLSVLSVKYSGIKGYVAGQTLKRFWAHFGGATSTRGGLSVEAIHAAQGRDFGAPCTHAPEDLANSAGVVVWGKNIAVTRVHCLPFLKQAQKNGAPLFVIDPVRCATARRADRHFAIRPGSDGMLAIGVARRLLEESAIDESFVAQHCRGFEAYREMVMSADPEAIRSATDLEQEQIDEIARLYATTKPLATMIGLGPSYWRNGGNSTRLIDALVALSGNIGVSGGGANTDTWGAQGLDLSTPQHLPECESRQLLLPRLGDEILAARAPSLRAGWVAGANPVATCPDTGRVREGLASLDFLVVVDQFMTATAELADLFLPCATYLEMEDLVGAYGHYWLSLCQEVVPPLGEARSDMSIMQELAHRLGFGSELAGEPREWIERMLAPMSAHGVTYEALKQRPLPNPLAETVPLADRRFGTPSGRFEFTDRAPSPRSTSGSRPLHLVATKTLKMVNAQINTEHLASEPLVRVHSQTARERGLEQDDVVLVESAVGRVRARLKIDDDVRSDVLLFNPAAWRGDLQGVNQLRESALADMGDAAAMHETLVSLSRSDSPSCE